MVDRERFQALMLEHLYGLLEADEARELQAFLATPEGDSLRHKAEQWQSQIAGAAKSDFPNVRFTPPAKSSGTIKPARVEPTPNTMKGVWTRWGVAAAVLLVVGGLGGPAAYQFVGWYAQSRDLKEKQFALNTHTEELNRLNSEKTAAETVAKKELEQATAASQDLVKNYSTALAAARKAIEEKDFVVKLTGPAHIQPGAPNKWTIEALHRQGAFALPKRMEVSVKDAKDTEVFKQTYNQPVAATALDLPVAVWEKVKPGTDLFLEVVAFTDDNRKSVLAERIPLARPVYVTHLVTDKPLYKPGETVYFRSLTLDRSTLLPPGNDLFFRFRLRDPSDAVIPLEEGNGRLLSEFKPVLGPDQKPVRGIGVGAHDLGPDVPGGEYKLDLFEVNTTNGAEILLETRKFIVNKYEPDTFEKKLEFDGKSYGAGEYVQARIDVTRTGGGPMTDAWAEIVATANGNPIHREQRAQFTIVRDPESGGTKAFLNVRFKLPTDLFEKAPRKDIPPVATLSVAVQDRANVETIVRPIPLVTKNLSVEFFPEGGDLIDGVPGRVYFQVRNPIGKPADLKGYFTNGQDKIDIATVTDPENPGVNRGHGSFTLTPKANTPYFLKITSPGGIIEPTKDGFPLPVAKADGVALTSLDAVTEKGGAIRVRLQSKNARTVHVGAYARGRLIAHRKLDIEAGKPVDVALQGDESAGGVTRVTVFDEPKAEGGRNFLVPRAERLVYRKPAEALILNVNPDKTRYSPSGKVKLDISAMNEKEAPTPAIVLVAVINQSVIAMADNKTDRQMPTHFLLSGDVKHPAELEHADFLLTDHPKAGLALDLLLGTQGWRRFAEQNLQAPNPADRPEVERMMVAHGQRMSPPLELFKLEEQRINAEFQPKLEQSNIRVNDANDSFVGFRATKAPEYQSKIDSTSAMVSSAKKAHTDSAAELYQFETRSQQIRSWALPAFLLGLLALTLGGVVLAMSRVAGQRRPYFATAACSFALCVLTIGGVIATRATDGTATAWQTTQRDAAKRDTAMMPAEPMPGRPRGMAKGAMRAPADKDMLEMAEPKAMDRVPPQAEGHAPPAPAGPGGPGIRAMVKPAAADPAAKEVRDDAAKDMKKFDEAAAKFAGDFDKAKALGAKGAKGEKQRLEKAQLQMMGKRDGQGLGGFGRGNQLGGGGGFAGGGPGLGMPALPGAGGPGGGAGFAMVAGEMAADVVPMALPFMVREYAHVRDASLGDLRTDFTETVCWKPVVVLPDTGKTTIEFQLADNIGRYQVLVAGHTTDGRIGSITKTIEARKPFSVDPKLPQEISNTDTIELPIRVTNDSDDRRNVTFTLTPVGLKVNGPPTTPDGKYKEMIDLAPNGKGRKFYRLQADRLEGEAGIALQATSDPAAEADAIGRKIKIVPDGFPAVGSVSDMLERSARGSVLLPKDMVPGTLKMRLEIYPTSMSDLVKGLDGLLQEPSGCFEQTSTTNYPNTLILDYLNQTNQANPEGAKRAKELLDRGYARLTSYECADTPLKLKQGFEWFGSPDMAHEALTAYGLLQFKDMARVHAVDPEMIKRTQAFLLSRRDGKGGFLRNARALDSFGGAPKHTTDAYIVWALVESDPDDTEKLDLKKEIDAIKAEALKEDSTGGKDAYFVALTANVLLQRGDRETALKLFDRLKEKHMKAGAVTGAETSITRSGGRDLEIETTAITLLGWLRANDSPRYAGTIKDATKWISQQRGGYGGFGSTQSTIMALKALILHAKKSAHPSENGEVRLLAGGKLVGTKKFSEKDVEVIGLEIEKPEAIFKAGEKIDVEITTDAKHPYPFALSYTYTTLTPVSAEKCQVRVGTKLASAKANEGDTVAMSVSLQNLEKKGQGMAVAIVGLPAGLKVPTDMKQLIDLREKKQISFFEIRGRELVIYWRELAPEQKIDLTVDLVCDVPGIYRGPASRGYLYYNADHKHWVEPLAIKIAAADVK